MSAHLVRAQFLLSTHRPVDAEREARSGLELEPENRGLLHALCSALTEQDKLDAARAVAGQLVGLAPDWADAHLMVCFIELEAEHYKLAERAGQQAQRLAPGSAVPRQNLAVCYYRQKFWHSALSEAEAGLALDTENVGCANIRSLVHTVLGHETESMESAESALQLNPENANSQYLAGLAKLHAGDHRMALGHFSEALRLNPNNESARSGLVAAMKAHNPLYRALQAIAGLSLSERRTIIILGIIGYNLIDNQPGMKIWATIISVLWVSFIMLVWLNAPFFNFMLWLDRRGRHALLPRERAGVVALLCGLAGTVAWYLAGVMWHRVEPSWALAILLFAVPLTHAFDDRHGWRRITGFVLAATMGILLLASLFFWGREPLDDIAQMTLFLLALLLMLAGRGLNQKTTSR